SRADLQRLLDQVRGTPHTHAVNYAFLRSLKQAEYSPEPIGHYALAAGNYCHFTSPIRRYPDLTVHRLLDRLALRQDLPFPGESELVVTGQHCSRTERRAEQAERELVKVKLLTYMSHRVGDEFEAIVTGVQDWGFFCQAVEVPAEGLVHVSTLDDDQYYFEAAAHQLTGRRSGRQYRLGARVRVVVAHVDVDRRQLDFRVAGSRSARSVKHRERVETAPGLPVQAARVVPSGGRLGMSRFGARQPAGRPPGRSAGSPTRHDRKRHKKGRRRRRR